MRAEEEIKTSERERKRQHSRMMMPCCYCCRNARNLQGESRAATAATAAASPTYEL